MSCERYWNYSDSRSFFSHHIPIWVIWEKEMKNVALVYLCNKWEDRLYIFLPTEWMPADAWNNVDDISKWHRKQGRLFHLLCLAWWEVIFQLHKHSNLFVSAWTALFAFGRSYTINQPAVCLEFNLRGSWKGHDDWKNYSNQAASKVDKHPNLEM